MRIKVLVVLALMAPFVQADAQKNCRKGIPCGNTCIAATKTCRITSSQPAAPPTASRPAAVKQQGDSIIVPAPWVASSRGSTYYRAGCKGARQLSPRNLIYFKSEDEAQKAGYRHSVQAGC